MDRNDASPAQSPAAFEPLLAAVDQPALLVDGEGIVRLSNETARRLFGPLDGRILSELSAEPAADGEPPHLYLGGVDYESSVAPLPGAPFTLHTLRPQRQRLEHAVHALLADIDVEVLAGASMDEVAARICVDLVERFCFPFCWFGLCTREEHVELRAWHGEGLDGGERERIDIDLDRGGRSPAMEAVYAGERRLAEGDGGRPILALPLRRRDEVLGVLVLWGGERPFDDATLHALERLADRLTLALAALRDRERLRLQGAALASAANAVIITDPEGRIAWANDAFTRLSGYAVEEVIGDTPRVLESGRVAREVFAELWSTILSGRSWRGELINRSKGGSLYHVAQTITPILDEAGEVSHFVAIHEDISERKLAERQLQEARDAALHASRGKSEFLANISHEIRTPMNGVLGMLGLLADTPLDGVQRDYLDSARRSGDLLLSLLNNILDYAKIEAGRIDLEQIPFDPRETAEEVLALYMVEAAGKRLELGLLVEPEVPDRVVGDPTRLRQILINLMGNAVKFTALGEVALHLSAVEEGEGGLELRCRVSDSGIGIAPEAQGHIFDVFSQADGSTTRKYGGSGLGLAICRELVQRMGGEIGVRSEVGVGSTFHFSVQLEPAEGEAGEAERAPPALRGLRLVAAEPHPLGRDVLENLLALSGIDYEILGRADEALDALRAAAAEGRPAEVVIAGLQLPGNGAELLARAVCEKPELGGPRLLALAAPGNDHAVLNRIAPLCGGLIRKPLRRAPLLHRLLALCGGEASEPAPAPAPRKSAGTVEGEIGGGARILVAEDNPINQRVVHGMLERLGYRVSLADNGREAVAIQRDAPHALILMDVQMPELDGLQAAAAIRAEERGEGRTPIIALTAGTGRDREPCRRAGMDDILFKPIQIDRLRELLARWLDHEGASSDPGEETMHAAIDGIDLQTFDGIRELMGDALAEVVESFLDDGRERLGRMRDELAADNGEQLQRAAHSLKGAAANLGLSALSEACARLDDNTRQNGCDGAPPLLERVEAAFLHAEEALARLMNG